MTQSDAPFQDQEATISPALRSALARFDDIFAIVSPPRCSSTAMARIFWEQPSIRYYSHEPFETTYYANAPLDEVRSKLSRPIDLLALKNVAGDADGAALTIKEMPYQVGRHFPLLAAIATRPLIFLMRDPRLSIASRMRKKQETGDSPFFPRIESGWELWRRQVAWCRERGIPHALVDSTDFRNQPLAVLPALFDFLEVKFSPESLTWRPCPEVDLDNLGGKHRHLYEAVLRSTGVRPETSEIPPLDFFPEEHGWRAHVEACLEIYRETGDSSARIRPAESLAPTL